MAFKALCVKLRKAPFVISTVCKHRAFILQILRAYFSFQQTDIGSLLCPREQLQGTCYWLYPKAFSFDCPYPTFIFLICARTKQVDCIDDPKIRLEEKLLLFPLFRLNTILVKNLETLVSISPSPMLIWVSQWSECFKIRVAQHWGGRRHISGGKTVWSRNLMIVPENSRETVSVSTICDEYCGNVYDTCLSHNYKHCFQVCFSKYATVTKCENVNTNTINPLLTSPSALK